MRSSEVAKYRKGVVIGSATLNTVGAVLLYTVLETFSHSSEFDDFTRMRDYSSNAKFDCIGKTVYHGIVGR